MFPVVKDGEGGRKLSCRENDVGRSPESFGMKSGLQSVMYYIYLRCNWVSMPHACVPIF